MRHSSTFRSGKARSGSIRSTSAHRNINPTYYLTPPRSHSVDRNLARTFRTARIRQVSNDPRAIAASVPSLVRNHDLAINDAWA